MHDSGIERAYLYIKINDRRLWLSHYAVLDDCVVAGFDGDSEQCEDCGQDIEEHGTVHWDKRRGCLCVKCGCGAYYLIRDHNTGLFVEKKPARA